MCVLIVLSVTVDEWVSVIWAVIAEALNKLTLSKFVRIRNGRTLRLFESFKQQTRTIVN